MIDTIACMIKLAYDLDDVLFQGASISEDFDDQQVTARLYRNPVDGIYEPRVTYWRSSGYLKVEFSLQKMIDQSNLSHQNMLVALRIVQDWIGDKFDVHVPIREWIVQRVDYTWDFVVDNVDAYLHVLGQLRIGGMTRHEHKSGVVWKAGNRWVKFYRKDDTTLRYEVSNYRSAVKYMCARWFSCERVVEQLVHCGRALYILALYWDKLGLFDMDMSADVAQVMALRDVFDQRVGMAYYALMCLSVYGVESYKSLGLMSSSSYYSWKSELREAGFVYVDLDDVERVDVVAFALSPLRLPVEFARRNLKEFSTAGALSPSKNFPEIRDLLGVSDSVALAENIEGMLNHAYA